MGDSALNAPAPPASSLDDWVELIQRHNMPIFDNTVRQVIALTQDDLAPISDLARIVLQDTALTTRVLRLANSVVYNPTTTGISTVTRAVVMLGFDAVRNMCLALTLVDAMVGGAARERFSRELARTMHASTQARGLAMARNDRSPEEVFIAAMLSRVGELAFWCFSGEAGDRLEALSNQPGMPPEQAQEAVLGFRLNHLTRRLIRDWHLTELLSETTGNPTLREDRLKTLALGYKIARCAEEKGWRSNDMQRLIEQTAQFTRLQPDDARTLLFQKARIATTIAVELGARFVTAYIPQPGSSGPEPDQRQDQQDAPETVTRPARPGPDTAMQARILRELETLLAEGRCDFNLVMELVLEGIHRGVGMERVLFAITTPDKQTIRAKYALGDRDSELSRRFVFERTPHRPNLIFQIMDTRVARSVSVRDYASSPPNPLTELIPVIGRAPFVLAPIVIGQQCIGVCYADRASSGLALDAASFADFKHFVQQANAGLTRAAVGPRSG